VDANNEDLVAKNLCQPCEDMLRAAIFKSVPKRSSTRVSSAPPGTLQQVGHRPTILSPTRFPPYSMQPFRFPSLRTNFCRRKRDAHGTCLAPTNYVFRGSTRWAAQPAYTNRRVVSQPSFAGEQWSSRCGPWRPASSNLIQDAHLRVSAGFQPAGRRAINPVMASHSTGVDSRRLRSRLGLRDHQQGVGRHGPYESIWAR